MRVAVVTTSWPEGPGDPSGHFVRAEALALEQAGHEVVIVAPPSGGAFGWPGVAARLRERPSRALEAMSWIRRAREQLATTGAARAIAHWTVPCAWPVAVAAHHVPLEAVSHGGDVRLLTAVPAMARRFVVDAIASRAGRWRFVSGALLDELLGALDYATRERVRRIAYIEPAKLELPDVSGAVALRRGMLGKARVGVSVGRLVASKRVDRIIDHVARTRDVDALVVVGDGPERRRLEQIARERGVDARFLGLLSREEALAWIGAADTLFHASTAEGMSTVMREADALGTRVLLIS